MKIIKDKLTIKDNAYYLGLVECCILAWRKLTTSYSEIARLSITIPLDLGM